MSHMLHISDKSYANRGGSTVGSKQKDASGSSQIFNPLLLKLINGHSHAPSFLCHANTPCYLNGVACVKREILKLQILAVRVCFIGNVSNMKRMHATSCGRG